MNRRQKSLLVMLLLAAEVVHAGIIIEAGVGAPGVRSSANPWGMPTIVVAPPMSNSGYLAQRSMSWGIYNRHDSTTGYPLIYTPAVAGTAGATSERQIGLRSNIGRANAYRLNYFGK